MAPSHGQGAATCGWPPCPCTACDLCPQGWALAGACDPGLTSGASPRLQEATQMADGRAAPVHDPAAPGDSVPAEELSVSRDWTLDSVCTPDSDPKEKE